MSVCVSVCLSICLFVFLPADIAYMSGPALGRSFYPSVCHVTSADMSDGYICTSKPRISRPSFLCFPFCLLVQLVIFLPIFLSVFWTDA